MEVIGQFFTRVKVNKREVLQSLKEELIGRDKWIEFDEKEKKYYLCQDPQHYRNFEVREKEVTEEEWKVQESLKILTNYLSKISTKNTKDLTQ